MGHSPCAAPVAFSAPEARPLTTRVILVRHGQSSYNAAGRIQGRSDLSVLTEAGQASAQQVGQVLKTVALDAVYCSPLQRAHHTAQIICGCFPEGQQPTPQPTQELMEIDLPLWEGLARDEVKATAGESYKLWQEHPEQLTMVVDPGWPSGDPAACGGFVRANPKLLAAGVGAPSGSDPAACGP